MSWFSRLKNTLRTRRLDDDLAEEIRDHVERRAAALREEGLSPAEAQRRAAARFGNATSFREQSREIRLWAGLDSAVRDLHYAWRGMRRSPVFAATAVLSLSLAIGANTAIYSIVDVAMLRPLPVPEPDLLVTLAAPDLEHPGQNSSGERDTFSYPLFLQLRAAADGAARLALFSPLGRVEAQGPEPDAPIDMANEQFISGEAFEILRVPPALGRVFSSEEDRFPGGHAVAVLSHDYWQRRFHGDPAVLGRTIRLNGQAFRVVGVAAAGFFGIEPGKFVDLWVPAMTFDPGVFTNAAFNWSHIVGRLSSNVTLEQLRERLQPAFLNDRKGLARQSPDVPEAIREQMVHAALRVHPGANGVSAFRGTFSRPLWIVMSVAAGILLIACSNIASLLLARSSTRSAEMALRVSLGAGRWRLVRQLLTESLLLSMLAGVVGWILALETAPALIALLSTESDPVRFALAMDARVFLFCAGVCALSALVFGLLPAWQATATQPMQSLRHHGAHAGRLRMGRFFVGAQVAFAFCLVVAGAGFLVSLRSLFAVDTGFDPRGVTVLTIGARHGTTLQQVHQLQSRVASLANVQGAAVAWSAIFGGSPRRERIIAQGKPASEREEIMYRVSPGYFAVMRTPLQEGRDFDPRDTDGTQPIPTIVNRAFARRYFGSETPIGKEYQRTDGARHRIIGLAANAYYGDLRNGPQPVAYIPMKPPVRFVFYVRSTLDAGSVMRLVERESAAAGPFHIVQTTTLSALVGNTLLREKLLAGIGGVFAGLGLLLAAIGLFGLLNYSVSCRTKEISIRAALGARRQELWLLVLKDLFGMTAGGLAVGLVGSVMLMGFVRSLLFGVRPADPRVIVTAIAVFVVAALLAGGLPARRAAAVDPIAALREE
jgi:putative ABC transport system permease protein